jgi:hypothetical protein
VILGLSEGDDEGLELGLSLGIEEGSLLPEGALEGFTLSVGADVPAVSNCASEVGKLVEGAKVPALDTGASVGDCAGISVGGSVGCRVGETVATLSIGWPSMSFNQLL